MKIGVNNLVNFGLLWTGLSTVALGMVEFIPHDQGMWFAVCGFAINLAALVILHRRRLHSAFHQLLKFLSVYDILVSLY